MFINCEQVIVKEREKCAVCDSCDLDVVFNLPKLPLTGLYCSEPMQEERVAYFDQGLLMCRSCSHAQLAKQVSTDFLYGGEYSFRTSVSATARQGTNFFLNILNKVAPQQQFRGVLDLGCNDLHLLKQLEDRSSFRLGIDPVWEGKEQQNDDSTITVVGTTIEKVDLRSIINEPIDLVICRHTLEHIDNPRAVLEKLFEHTTQETLFLFEVPGFGPLVDRLRFDQVFHQHLQYFSLASFGTLIQKIGGSYLGHWENYHDWGSMVIAFKKSPRSFEETEVAKKIDINLVQNRYQLFVEEMQMSTQILQSLSSSSLYGYGAAQMLPILAYHMGTDFSNLIAVIDDDNSKKGLYYNNLPLVIQTPDALENWEEASIFITAVDNGPRILPKLLTLRPKRIIMPFRMI